MLQRIFALLFSVVLSFALSAQTDVGLVAHYTFDNNLDDATGNTANTGIGEGSIEYRCGVSGEAILLDGAADLVRIPNGNNVNAEFDTEDFTISFYYKPIGLNGQQYILSKRSPDCIGEQEMYIRYVPQSSTVNGVFTEIPLKSVSLVHAVNNDACWQNVTIVRDDIRVKLYINGKLEADLGTATRIDLFNDGDLLLGSSDCMDLNEVPFHGLIDELRIYNRPLDDDEVQSLLIPVDDILSPDTLLFLGGYIDIELSNSCAQAFTWTTHDGLTSDISSVTASDPTITPSIVGAQHFTVEMRDVISSCVARDSIRVTVRDPDLISCEKLFLPKAFTPNNDGLNDTYGIDNQFAIESLISFEIFDRWGGQVFSTSDVNGRWDGFFNGKAVNSGVMLYKVTYLCEGVERTQTGSLTILR